VCPTSKTLKGFQKPTVRRTARQKFREPRVALQDYIILLITGAALGFLSTTNDDQMGGFSAHSNSILAVGKDFL
jgi:hypothetical protein